MATPKTAYSLVRFSTDKQEFGSSKHRQLERCRQECDRRGWSFDENLCISDLGVSAFRGKNFQPKYALGKFIEASKNGLLLPNPVLIVENPDRFSRDLLDNADSELWGLVKRGVDVLFLSNGLLLTKGDENDPAKRAILLFEFHRSHGESKRKSDLVSAAIAKKIADATSGKHVAFGGIQPAWIDFVGKAKQEGEFRLNATAALIRRIVESYLGGESMLHIAATLNRERIDTIDCGKRWTQGQVRSILRRELLLGHATFRGQRVERYYPPVVTDPEWARLQAMLTANKIRKGGNSEDAIIANLFRNRCFCAACHGRVSSHFGRGKIRYYKCQDARQGRCTVRSMIPITAIEEDFFGVYLAENPSGLLSKQDAARQQKIAAIQNRIAALNQQVATAVDLMGAIPMKELRAKLEALEAERVREKSALDEELKADRAAYNAPAAYGEIRDALATKSGAVFNRASIILSEQLADNETRKKLLSLLPSIVGGLVLDLENGRYAARALTGELSDWRDVSAWAIKAR